MLLVTSSFALLVVTVLVILGVSFSYSFFARVGRGFASIPKRVSDWWHERKLRKAAVLEAEARIKLLEEQRRNEEIRTFLYEKKQDKE